MSAWSVIGTTQVRTLGILELHLTDEPKQFGPYLRYGMDMHLRAGVQIRSLSSGEPLTHLTVRAKTDFLARLEAEHLAQKWLEAHLDALCAGEKIP